MAALPVLGMRLEVQASRDLDLAGSVDRVAIRVVVGPEVGVEDQQSLLGCCRSTGRIGHHRS